MSNNSGSPHGSGKDGKSGSNAGSHTSGTSFSSFRGKSDPIRFGASAFMGKKNSKPHGSQDGSSPSFSPISPASPSNVPPEFLPPKHRSTQTSMPASAHKATQVPSSASTVSSLDTTSRVRDGLDNLSPVGAEDAESVVSGAASDVPGIAVTKASSEAGSTTRDANIEPPASSSPARVRSPSVQSSLSESPIRPDGVSSPRSGSTISGNNKSTSPTASVRSLFPAPTPPRSRYHSSTSASRDQPRSSAGPDVGQADSASRSVHREEDAHSEQEPRPKGKEKATKDSARRRSRGSKDDKRHGRRLITNESFSKVRTKTRTWEFDPRTGQIDTTSDGDVKRDHKRELEPKRKEGEERNHGHETEKASSRLSSTSWGFKAGPNRRMSVTQTEATEDTTEYKRSR